MRNKIKNIFSSAPPPSKEEIGKWLDDQLSSAELHDLEKTTQSNEFYTEAIEGLEMLDDKQALNSITNDLNARIDESLEVKKRKNSFVYWSVAASSILVCGIIFTLLKIQFDNAKRASETAMNVVTPQQIELQNSEPSSDAEVILEQAETNNPSTSNLALSAPVKPTPQPLLAPSISSDELGAAVAMEREEVIDVPAMSKQAQEDYSDVFSEMIAFASAHVADRTMVNTVVPGGQMQEELTVAMDYKRKKESKNDVASTKSKERFSSAPKAIEDKARDDDKDVLTKKEEPNLEYDIATDSVTYLHNMEQVIQRIQRGSLGVAEQSLDKLMYSSNQNPELSQWLKASLLLKKGDKAEAIVLLKKLEYSSSVFSAASTRILNRIQ